MPAELVDPDHVASRREQAIERLAPRGHRNVPEFVHAYHPRTERERPLDDPRKNLVAHRMAPALQVVLGFVDDHDARVERGGRPHAQAQVKRRKLHALEGAGQPQARDHTEHREGAGQGAIEHRSN